jgi:hypothetical protein
MLDGVVDVLARRRTAPMGDRGMIVGVVSWILVVVMVFTLLTRLAMKFAVAKRGRKFGLDDVFIVLAAVGFLTLDYKMVSNERSFSALDKQQQCLWRPCML